MSASYPQNLIIHCPSHIATKYEVIPNGQTRPDGLAPLFNIDGNLQLLIAAEDYARIKEGEEA